MELVLETKTQPDKTVHDGPVAMTPLTDEDCWLYRVKVSERQAIVGFPKFGLIGIGFAVEEDWNTNLPSGSGTEKIYEHIAHDKGDESISREDCLTAIRMIQEAAAEAMGGRS